MRFEELPAELKEAITSLKHGSLSIEADVIEALAIAESLRDFKERASCSLSNLMQEVRDVLSAFEHRQLTEEERDRMIDIYASGPLTYLPDIDDKLLLLDLIDFYDSDEKTKAVVEKHGSDFFYAENGSVLKEWYYKEKEATITETPVEVDEFREMAADVIAEVTEAIQQEYPDLKPKKEFLEESPDAAVLYGESYYNLESSVEDQLREKSTLKKLGNLCIISHHGELKVILEIENARSLNIQSLLDEYLQTTDNYFGDSDFVRFLQSRNIMVRNHPFDELTTGGR